MSLRFVCIFFIIISADSDVIAQKTEEICGIQASENLFPWLVGIEYAPSYEPRPRIECTGALIDDRHVVSKANCFVGISVRGVAKSVRLGPYNAVTGENCFGEVSDNNCTDIGAIRIIIELILPHPEYDEHKNWLNQAGSQHDIALIRLRETVSFSDLIRPICLPSGDVTLPAADQELYITGLLLDAYNPSKKEKYYETANYTERTECQKLLDLVVGEDNICAKNAAGIESCLRTGGLLMNKKNNRFELVGLLELKTSCATQKIFNHLYLHLQWIQDEIQKWIHGCGRRKVNHVELITHGEDTKAGDWPWHAAILRLKIYICGGTLISKTIILTAAHCVTIEGEPASPDIFSVVLEKYYLLGGDTQSQEKQVQSVIVHEDFTPKRHFNNDIALLKLKTEVTYNDYVQPACLWSSEVNDRLPSNRDFGTVAGWGFDQTDRLSSQLKQATMPKVPDVTCVMKNPVFYANALSNNRKFCAGWANGTSICNGDSGGGFLMFIPDVAKAVSEDAPGSWHVRGIVSISAALRNHARCDPYQYGVFTDIANYTSWIRRHLFNQS